MTEIDPGEFLRACDRAGLDNDQVAALWRELRIPKPYKNWPKNPPRQAHLTMAYNRMVNALIVGTAVVIALLAVFWLNE